MEHGFKVADLRSQLGSLSIRSLPIITQEQITLPQHTIGRRSMGEFNDRVYEVVRRGPRGEGAAYEGPTAPPIDFDWAAELRE